MDFVSVFQCFAQRVKTGFLQEEQFQIPSSFPCKQFIVQPMGIAEFVQIPAQHTESVRQYFPDVIPRIFMMNLFGCDEHEDHFRIDVIIVVKKG